MSKVAIMTDTNCGIMPAEGKELGILVIPTPFMIDGTEYLEGVTLTQDDFFKKLAEGADVSTSQPSPASLLQSWDLLLEEYDEIVYIPLSSGLSSSCQTATMLAADDYEGKVFVVNNQRISVTMRQSVLDAIEMKDKGLSAKEIKEELEAVKFESSIYIMLDTLYYLKKGGRITPAAAALGTLLKLKPVLQIQGEKLDAFAKARTASQGKNIMINAMISDIENRFGGLDAKDVNLAGAYSYNLDKALEFKSEVEAAIPGYDMHMDPLSLVVSCHIGPGALAIACSRKIHL
ncbi:DegV family protein [Butyrivibrio sp. NC2002]|uniref:DegV family protein n=1 Tax=Butyrivibrio sp. NC2002 TaxID=1410610 RepID=UPI00055AC70C|nr:DegV family protein [Butyrivibrio sp. NC2002]